MLNFVTILLSLLMTEGLKNNLLKHYFIFWIIEGVITAKNVVYLNEINNAFEDMVVTNKTFCIIKNDQVEPVQISLQNAWRTTYVGILNNTII
jgi:hypothetical protein